MRSPTTVALALALSCQALLADSVTLNPDADTSIMEGSPENGSNFGAQDDSPAGTTGSNNGTARSRALFRFDVAGNVPAGSTITGGVFSITVQNTPSGGGVTSNFELHRMLVSWVEGVGFDRDNPGGDPANAGETTWNKRLHPSTPWGDDQPGGKAGTDFDSSVSATLPVLGEGPYRWTLNAKGIADLQSMLDSPGSNFGWMFVTDDEGTGKTARRFYMREAPGQANPVHRGPGPSLKIIYDPPPPPPPPELSFVGYDGANLTVRFLASAGVSYEVQVADTLTPEGWVMHMSFDPTEDGEIQVSVPSSGDPRKFVRIKVGG